MANLAVCKKITDERWEEIFGKKTDKDIQGRYYFDKELGKFVKYSDKVHTTENVGRVDSPYFDLGLDTVVKSERHKRDLLKRNDMRIIEKGERTKTTKK